ncbi:SMI1/KNR4 family protein [Streptomyces sp. NPDC051211]|uniref:SMI1/KNR4 family protein n=1 Tax=Streptomyces sp. NPDC051211 TaxID=3154643 RepID=UPI00345041FF
MELPQLIGRLVSTRVAQYLEAPDLRPLPGIRLPADDEQINMLEQEAGQSLDEDYRRFLKLTDGMDGLFLSMPVFGACDWEAPANRVAAASRFASILLESGRPQDVGLPESVRLFPVSVNTDGSQGIFMIDIDGVPERFSTTSA